MFVVTIGGGGGGGSEYPLLYFGSELEFYKRMFVNIIKSIKYARLRHRRAYTSLTRTRHAEFFPITLYCQFPYAMIHSKIIPTIKYMLTCVRTHTPCHYRSTMRHSETMTQKETSYSSSRNDTRSYNICSSMIAI